jgi:flagellar motor switch protein FliN/FliY
MAKEQAQQQLDQQPSGQPKPANFPQVEDRSAGRVPRGVRWLSDVNLTVAIQLGTSQMFLREILQLRNGSIVELEKLAGEPVDVYLNGVPFAKGEVVVIGDSLGVRVTEIEGQEELIQDGG